MLLTRPMGKTLQDRIKERLAATGKSMRAASQAGGLSPDTLGKYMSEAEPLPSPSLATIEKLAKGLETTAPWLAYGIAVENGVPVNQNTITVDRDLLRSAVGFVLEAVGPRKDLHTQTAEIFPEALVGAPIEAVERHPLRSFQVRLQLGSEKFALGRQK